MTADWARPREEAVNVQNTCPPLRVYLFTSLLHFASIGVRLFIFLAISRKRHLGLAIPEGVGEE